MHPVLDSVTRRIEERSAATRGAYLARIRDAAGRSPNRGTMACSNLAHGIAVCSAGEKTALAGDVTPNIGIVTAYNDMLSAHQPYVDYPERIKAAASTIGAVAQVAGGVPAMCDGVTQGREGMDLSLFSRDVIALSTAVALSHDLFDAMVLLGICDKIVPGLVIGALSFGHVPAVFIPAGPMATGLANKDKARVREDFAVGKVGREELLAAESAAYHGRGTCTFYGTANSNQMLMEFMGLQLPGGSFVHPDAPLRDKLTDHAVAVAVANTRVRDNFLPMGEMIDARSWVNAIVGLLSTGGSTNHTMHLVAMARSGGIVLDWRDFAELSHVVPTLAHVYPNGSADVNQFHAAGGLGFVMRELLDAGLLHDEVRTILGEGLGAFLAEPFLSGEDDGVLEWRDAPRQSLDTDILRGTAEPFDTEGGLRVVEGNLGRAIIKTSAVKPEFWHIHAPARVFHSQEAFAEAFKAGELKQDFVAVLPAQGAQARGMPELHKLTPYLGLLQNQGFKVALLTDGRMSGASGKVLAAIHVSPEAVSGGPIGRIRDGDLIEIDAREGRMDVLGVDGLMERDAPDFDLEPVHSGVGRELFSAFRGSVGHAEHGASIFFGE